MKCLSTPQKKIIEKLKNGKNIFIIGDTNTGKSFTVLEYLKWAKNNNKDLSKILFVDDIPYLNDEIIEKIKSFNGQIIITSKYHNYLFGCYPSKKNYKKIDGKKIYQKKIKTICAKSLVYGELCSDCIAELKYMDRQDDIIYQKNFGLFDDVIVLKRPIKRYRKSNNEYCLYDNNVDVQIVCYA